MVGGKSADRSLPTLLLSTSHGQTRLRPALRRHPRAAWGRRRRHLWYQA